MLITSTKLCFPIKIVLHIHQWKRHPVYQSLAAAKMWNASRFCVSSLRRGHANLLCIVPILVYVLPKQVHFHWSLLTLSLAKAGAIAGLPRPRSVRQPTKARGAVVAEWLRRLTRNQMGSPRTGSNPVGCEFFFMLTIHLMRNGKKLSPCKMPPVRIELTTPGLRDQCSATELKRPSFTFGRA